MSRSSTAHYIGSAMHCHRRIVFSVIWATFSGTRQLLGVLMKIYLDFEEAIAATMSSLLTRAASRLRPTILLLLALSLIGPGAAYAQTSSTSGMGATSPLG